MRKASEFEAQARGGGPAIVVIKGDVAPVAGIADPRLHEEAAHQLDLEPGLDIEPLVVALGKEQGVGRVITADVESRAADKREALAERHLSAGARGEETVRIGVARRSHRL